MKLDLLEKRILFLAIPSFLLIFLFSPQKLGEIFLYFSTIVFFFILFFLCTYWTKEWHPERQFIIGFLVSILHTFLFFLGGVFGKILAVCVSKITPYLLDYFKEIFRF